MTTQEEIKAIGAEPGTPTIIQVSGFARAGKNTVADTITKVCGFPQFGYAEPLKTLAKNLRLFDSNGEPMVHLPPGGIVEPRTYWNGQEQSKRNPLVELGRGLREYLGEDIWAHALWQGRKRELIEALTIHKGIVITDCRYQNEHVAGFNQADFWGARYALLYVERPDTPPQGEEATKTAVLRQQANHVLSNNGSLEKLEAMVIHVVEAVLRSKARFAK